MQFEENYHVITMAMPDYDGNQLRRFWGYSFTDMVDGLAFVIEPYLKKKSQVILVGHDWGAAIGFLYLSAYPGTVDKFVTLDIGRKENVDWVQIFYMTYLAIVFLLSRVIPDRLASLFMALYPWKAIGPCPYETEVPMTPRTMKAFMCYPYLKVIFEVVRSFFGEQFKFLQMQKPLVHPLPILFLFGRKKRVMFHSPSFLAELEKDPASAYKEYPDAGHYLHWTNAKEVGSDILNWLNNKPGG